MADVARPEHIVVIDDASKVRGVATGLAVLPVHLLREAGFPVTLICGDRGNSDISVIGAELVALLQVLERAAQARVRRCIAEHDTGDIAHYPHCWAKALRSRADRTGSRTVHRGTYMRSGTPSGQP